MSDKLDKKVKKLISTVLSFTKSQIALDMVTEKVRPVSDYVVQSVIEFSKLKKNCTDDESEIAMPECIHGSVSELFDEVKKEYSDPSTPWVKLFHRVESIMEPHTIIHVDYSFKLPVSMSVKLSIEEFNSTVKIQIDTPENGIEKLYQKIADINGLYLRKILHEKKIELSLNEGNKSVTAFCESHNCTWKSTRFVNYTFYQIEDQYGQIFTFSLYHEDLRGMHSFLEKKLNLIQKYSTDLSSKWSEMKTFLTQLGFEASCRCSSRELESGVEGKKISEVTGSVTAAHGKDLVFSFVIHPKDSITNLKRTIKRTLKEHEDIRNTLSKRLDHIGIPWSIKTDLELHMVGMGDAICRLEGGNYKEHLDTFITNNLPQQKERTSIKEQIGEILEPLDIFWGISIIDELIQVKVYPKGKGTETFDANRNDAEMIRNMIDEIKCHYLDHDNP